MNREKGRQYVQPSLSLIFLFLLEPSENEGPLQSQQETDFVQYYYRQVLLLEIGGFVFRRHFLM